MFGRLNRQLAKIIANEDEKNEANERATRSLRKLRENKRRELEEGGEGHGISDLVNAIQANDPHALLRHVEAHGTKAFETLTTNAAPILEKKQQERQAARDAFWAAAPPRISVEQDAALAALASPELQAEFEGSLRTGLIFDVAFRPAHDSDTSFVGGLPVAGDDFFWPHNPSSGRPLRFIGQIDVADIPDFPLRRHFPQSGALLFFAPDQRMDEHGALVQHVSLTNAAEVPLPEGATPYFSGFQNAGAGTGDGQIGWLHEIGSDAAPFSVLPKWPLAPRVAAFAARNCDFYNLEAPILPALLAEHNGDPFEFFYAFSESLNGPTGQIESNLPVFEDFPHVWGAVADVTKRFLPLIDACEAASGADTSPDVARLRSEVTAWHAHAVRAGVGTPMLESERAAFGELVGLMSADTGIELPAPEAVIGPKVLNDRRAIDSFLMKVQTHWLLSSLSSDPSTLSERMRQGMVDLLETNFAKKGFVQSLGHTHDVSGEETALGNVLLMQFPQSFATDTTGVYGHYGLRFWMSYEDFQNQNYDKVYCEY